MISIIVSSYRDELFDEFISNVKQTIGPLEYEVIKISNPSRMSIGQAYNLGMAQARYPYLVFSHEDILFTSHNWGPVLINIFLNDPSIGLVGVAGTKYKAWLYSGWVLWNSHSVLNFIDSSKEIKYSPILHGSNIVNSEVTDKVAEVVAVDGLFLASPSSIARSVPFSGYLKGFHCYDIDYSLCIRRNGYKVVATSAFSIYHSSLGSFNDSWIDATLELHTNWQGLLPASLNVPIDKRVILREEINAFRALKPLMRDRKRLLSVVFSQIYSFRFILLLGLPNWFRFQCYLLRSIFLSKELMLLSKRIFGAP